jgi:hypothetical protein
MSSSNAVQSAPRISIPEVNKIIIEINFMAAKALRERNNVELNRLLTKIKVIKKVMDDHLKMLIAEKNKDLTSFAPDVAVNIAGLDWYSVYKCDKLKHPEFFNAVSTKKLHEHTRKVSKRRVFKR